MNKFFDRIKHASVVAATGLAVGLLPLTATAAGWSELLRAATGMRTNGQADDFLGTLKSIAEAASGTREDNLEVDGQRVVLYGTAWCGYCNKARAYMRANNISYTDLDIEKNPTAKSEYRALQGRGVPLLLIGQQKMAGFDEAKFQQLYASFKANAGPSQANADGQPEMATTPPQLTGEAQGRKPADGSLDPAPATMAAGSVLTPRIAGVKVYADASKKGRPLATLSKAQEIVATGEYQGTMIKVQGAEVSGWVESVLLKAQ